MTETQILYAVVAGLAVVIFLVLLYVKPMHAQLLALESQVSLDLAQAKNDITTLFSSTHTPVPSAPTPPAVVTTAPTPKPVSAEPTAPANVTTTLAAASAATTAASAILTPTHPEAQAAAVSLAKAAASAADAASRAATHVHPAATK